MRRAAIGLCALMVAGATSASAQSAAPVVATASGQVAGVRQNGADAYLGIPFAQPPVGALRWKPPSRPAAWKGVRDGSRFGANCYQAPPGHFGPYTDEFLIQMPVSEDCLYLNVWTPVKRAKPLPVIVWLHGGGYGSGSASIPIYNGSRLATKGVVVVGVNYRLGAFGFLAHPDLTAESPRKTSGNYGLLDMVAALQWVKANAARFGGDPSHVTIMGQSAGAHAVNSLQLSPDAKGLFSAAIAESGSGGLPLGGGSEEIAAGETQGAAFATKLGARSLAELRATPADAIVKAATGAPPGSGGPPGPRFAPVVDHKVLLASPSDTTARPVSNVPLLSGFNVDEVGLSGRDQKTTATAFDAEARKRYGAAAARVLAAYPHARDAQASEASLQLARDQLFANLVLWEEARARKGQKVYAYLFDHPYPVPNAEKWGAFHTAEVPYVFGALDYPGRSFTAQDRKISDQIQAYWVNFATRGDPNPPGKTTWPAIRVGAYRLMELGDHPGARLAVSSSERLAALKDARKAAAATSR